VKKIAIISGSLGLAPAALVNTRRLALALGTINCKAIGRFSL
jgi:hypothetical protein